MFVIEVIPLRRGAAIESLSYYSAISYASGSIIEVPVRNSTIKGIVTSAKPVSAARTAVRAATFTLKKLAEQTPLPLPPSLIETAKSLQKLYPAHLGSILYALLPSEVREGEQMLEYTVPVSHADIRPEVEVLTARKEDRLLHYRSKIREVFAHRGSVMLVVPSSGHIDAIVSELSHGIENRVVVFSPTATKKKLQQAYESFYNLSTAKLIITTPTHAYIDRHDITHIIIEEAASRYYVSRNRPYLDHRTVLKQLARVTNRSVTVGDILPRSEEEHWRREEIYSTVGEPPKRHSFSGKLHIIEQSDEPTAETPFALFDKKTIAAIEETHKKRTHTFVYAARRGLAPVVVCNDCGHIFRCPDSGTPYSLFTTTSGGEEQRWFLSSVSGKRVKAADVCTECGSWRLRERGIGIQHIEREMKQLFPKIPIVLFDHTTATTPKKAKVLLGKFYETKGSVLLGTQMVLPWLDTNVATTIVTSHDATRAIPSWRAEEEFFSLLLQLREITDGDVYLQTRSEPDVVLDHAKKGLIEQFYDEELELRESLHYPPAAHFVLLTWQDTKASVEEMEQRLQEILSHYQPRFYSAPQSLHSKTKRFGLIRIPHSAWPNQQLMDTLRVLPPQIKVEIDPDRII